MFVSSVVFPNFVHLQVHNANESDLTGRDLLYYKCKNQTISTKVDIIGVSTLETDDLT